MQKNNSAGCEWRLTSHMNTCNEMKHCDTFHISHENRKIQLQIKARISGEKILIGKTAVCTVAFSKARGQ